MTTKITITLNLPDELEHKYNQDFLANSLKELEGKSLELPHPDDCEMNFDAEVTSVVLTRTSTP